MWKLFCLSPNPSPPPPLPRAITKGQGFWDLQVIYTSNLVTVHLPCVLFLSWPITRPHFSGKQFYENSEDHKIILKEAGVGSETSQIWVDFYLELQGFHSLHSPTIFFYYFISTSFCLFNKFRDFLNLSIKSTVFKICNNQHTHGITL